MKKDTKKGDKPVSTRSVKRLTTSDAPRTRGIRKKIIEDEYGHVPIR